MIHRNLEATIRINSCREILIEIYDPESGDFTADISSYSPGTHSGFDKLVGNRLYDYIDDMVMELGELEEKDGNEH